MKSAQRHIRDVDWLGAAVTLAVLTAGYFWVLHRPLRVLLQEPHARREQRQARQELDKQRQALARCQTRIRQLEQQLARSGATLVGPAHFDRYLAVLSRLAGNCGIRLMQVLPAGNSKRGEYIQARLSVRSRAGFPQFYRFLRQVEQADQALRVSHFVIQADRQGLWTAAARAAGRLFPANCRVDWTTLMYFAEPSPSGSSAQGSASAWRAGGDPNDA